jgi:heme/copper-type cytochrome/quinol oxidase subunit 1
MTRIAAITSHLGVLPAAVLLSVGLERAVPGATPQAVDVHLDDTFFVVAHFHVTVIVAVSVLAVSAVAYWFRTADWLLATSWALLLVHISCLVAPWRSEAGSAATVVSVAW